MARRIGFVDYKLENFHANVFLKALKGPLKERGWTVAGATALDAEDGRAWAKKNEVAWFESAQELDGAVDAYMVLAPSNPELHLQLCEQVFLFGKPMYVDKTFAPDLETAHKIFALADEHEAPVQTTSALRYTNVQEVLRDPKTGAVKHMITWGGGSSFSEYAIHPLELLISCMGHKAESMMRRGADEHAQLLINFSSGRTGVANVYTNGQTPFAASVTTDAQTKVIHVDAGQIFVNNAAAILDFFEAGKPNIDRRESLIIRRILDVAQTAEAQKQFVPL